MGGVRGILLNSSVLFASDDDENEDTTLRPGADYLLRKLRYSKVPTGLSYGQCLSAPKANLLQELATIYSYNCFILSSSSEDNVMSEVTQLWGDDEGSFMHVISSCREELVHNMVISGWLIVMLGSTGQKSTIDAKYVSASGVSSIFSINKLEELPIIICNLNKKARGKESMAVGYVMKRSREEDFAKRGAFPLCPTDNGLIFLPLNYELSISSQLQQVNAVLHKATDEIVAVEMGSSAELANKITFTRNMQELRRYIECQSDFCVIDPFSNIYPVLDRLKIQQILLGLETLNIKGRCKIRGAHFLKVDSFNNPNLEQRLVEAKLPLPNIVKPQVACGVADAHSMAIVFKVDNYKDLDVPLPAVVQEYVDHSSLLYKFYALGGKIFYAVKKSTPNADALMKLSQEKGRKPLLFDSLKSLPIAEEHPQTGCQEHLNANDQHIDLGLVTDAADWLRRMLGLTIFGFDVVIQEGTGDHVIVDVNYLPSFKEVPDDIAIPAFWEALKEKIDSEKSKQPAKAS
ncbi:Inositol 1 [Abeliophyllum distichum]|uniref:inositol-1,3,4-trisphosphate 5/6-kinase n=1 Tax=Abeliophyllum distichum TaxID=126358 RepID=A0ABD1NSY6_9LAMI